MRLRCLVAGGPRYFVSGLASALAAQGTVETPDWTTDAAAVEPAVRREPVDVVVAAFEPGQRAIALVRQLPGLPVVVLLPVFDAPTVAEALRAGAAGVHRKDQPPDQLARALGDAVAGDVSVPRAWIARALSPPVPPVVEAAVAPPRARLTAREREVVQLVVDGLSTKAMAAALGISTQTTKNHVRHVMAKLGLESRVQLCAWAMVQGSTPRTHEPA